MIVGTPTRLNLIPSGIMPVIYLNQTDEGYDKQFLVYNGDQPYDAPEGISVTIRGKKGDLNGITENVTYTVGSNLMTAHITQQMTAVAGDSNIFELVIVDTAGLRVGTINMVFAVEPDALGDAVISESEIGYAETVLTELQSVQAVNNQVQQNKANIAKEVQDRISAVNTETQNRIAAVNAEASARQAADTTLQNNINAEANRAKAAENALQQSINAEATARANADANLQSQISQIVAPSGEAPSAAEVQNARIAANGVTYDTLGDAIRTQTATLGDAEVMDIYDYESFALAAVLVHGSNYGSSFGTQKFRVTFKNFISFTDDILVFIQSGFRAYIPIKKSDGSYDAGSTIRKQYYIPKGTQFSIVMMRDSENQSEIANIAEFARAFKFKRMNVPTREKYISGFYRADNVYSGKAVRYSDGTVISASSYFFVYEFNNPEFEHIKVQSSLSDRTPAVIAFYYGGVYDSENSVQSTAAGDVQWAEADVPANCDKVLVTTRRLTNNDAAFTPTILISQRSDTLSNYISEYVHPKFDYGYIDANGVRRDQNYVRRMSSELIEYTNPYVDISINSALGLSFSIEEFYNGSSRSGSSWASSRKGQLYCDKFTITIKRVVDNSEVDLTLLTLEEMGLSIKVSGYKNIQGVSQVNDKVNSASENIAKTFNAKALGSQMFNGYKYCSHLFIDTIDDDEPVIPCQSVFDIEIAARLGFRMVELNAHKTATAGKFIVMHGESGKIGHQLKALDDSDISNLSIESVSFEDFKTKYVYRSKYEKYQVPVTDLEEALYACKKYNIIPFVMYAYDRTEIDIIRAICGNNFVLYVGSSYYLSRIFFDGAVQLYTSNTDLDQIKAMCKNMGVPFTYSLSPEALQRLTDTQISDIVKAIHDEGCYAGFAGAYQSPVANNKMFNLGFDYSGTGWEVEDFNNGNMANLHADLSFADFGYQVTPDGVLHLSDKETMQSQITDEPFLSKAILRIMFSGTIYVVMGNYIHHTFESDGRKELILSSYFMQSAPNFVLHADGDVDIFNCTYCASKC